MIMFQYGKRCIAIIPFFFIFSAYAQQENYTATYEGIINTANIKLMPQNDTNSSAIPAFKLPAMDVVLVEALVKIKNGRIVTILEDKQGGMTNAKRDSSVFEDNNWFLYSNGKKTAQKEWDNTVLATEEVKQIKGYACKKFIQLLKSGKKTELWVCKELPASISPFPIAIPVDGAILESKDIEANFVYTLTSLIKE